MRQEPLACLKKITPEEQELLRGAGGIQQELYTSNLKYIESNYRSGTLADVSDSVHLPAYTVSRLLKRHTGLNFKELLQKRKLEQAAYLLIKK